jgi:hypothetical protein
MKGINLSRFIIGSPFLALSLAFNPFVFDIIKIVLDSDQIDSSCIKDFSPFYL